MRSEADISCRSGESRWGEAFGPNWPPKATIYLTKSCSELKLTRNGLCIKLGKKERLSIAWDGMARLIVVGRPQLPLSALLRAASHGVPVTFLDIMGRAVGRLHPAAEQSPGLLVAQERFCKDTELSLEIAKSLVVAKISNSKVLLARNKKEQGELPRLCVMASKATDSNMLRGVEGAAGRAFFRHWAELAAPFSFYGRMARNPKDPVNALLSLCYTMLRERVAAAIQDVGLDPRMGVYHRGRGRHVALASDLMEPLRHAAERVVLGLIHTRAICSDHFKERCGLARLTGAGFAVVVRRFENVMARPFNISYDMPGCSSRTTLNAVITNHAEQLAALIRGRLKKFVPLRIT